MDGAVLEDVVQREDLAGKSRFRGLVEELGRSWRYWGSDWGMTPVGEKFLYCSYFFLSEGAHTRRKWMMP